VTAASRLAVGGVVLLSVLLLAARPAIAHPFGVPPTAKLTAERDRLLVVWSAVEEDAAWLPGGDTLADYLLERIRVAQGSRWCVGRARTRNPSTEQGIAVVHHCPERIGVVDVEITMLQDRHEAYRTFAFADAQPRQAVFTVAQPRHRLDFGGDSGKAAGPAVGWLQSAALLVVAAAVGAGARRRHHRREG
jgi:hypothetical protein